MSEAKLQTLVREKKKNQKENEMWKYKKEVN